LQYHSGFRSQASSWPSQPINVLIKSFLSAPKGAPKPIIADLGCGDAQLAQTLIPKGYTVFSFDLVEKLPWIVAAQCSKRLPLSGSQDGTGQGALVDVVVCCLSLMGNDWIGMVQESRRVLRKT
jgi:ribosomal RNA-processing protein 8